ncbi:hypothetical protein MY04_0393 [Flammeovirga sp. MY04]|uniref:hypothetical protein n=1 Tax=Flammeovirga sp. MY04 TaxID=1191459 RepID=UPI0008063425|nr:hypothetical protein [Flammeovirga sp. MY04]ANQ47775.1 hypothetical protein MY04_0393 [Flammeovirga sp. MY04]
MKIKRLLCIVITLFYSCKDTIDEDMGLQELVYKGEAVHHNLDLLSPESSWGNITNNVILSIYKNNDGSKSFEYFYFKHYIITYTIYPNDSLTRVDMVDGKKESVKKYDLKDQVQIEFEGDIIDVYKFRKLSDGICMCGSCYESRTYFNPDLGLICNYSFSTSKTYVLSDTRYHKDSFTKINSTLSQNKQFYPDEEELVKNFYSRINNLKKIIINDVGEDIEDELELDIYEMEEDDFSQ